jgi:hypothetical protein
MAILFFIDAPGASTAFLQAFCQGRIVQLIVSLRCWRKFNQIQTPLWHQAFDDPG